MPICSASSAVNFLDENKISFALAIPTNLGRIHPTPHSAMSPLLEKALEKTAPSLANLMSAYRAIMKPTPAAGPLMAAIIGFGTVGK